MVEIIYIGGEEKVDLKMLLIFVKWFFQFRATEIEVSVMTEHTIIRLTFSVSNLCQTVVLMLINETHW